MEKTKKEVLAEIAAHLQDKFGESFTPELFQLAKAKAVRWQKAAYGSTDWVGHYNESGAGCVDYFFAECLDTPDNQNSFNRQTARNLRSSLRDDK